MLKCTIEKLEFTLQLIKNKYLKPNPCKEIGEIIMKTHNMVLV